MESEGAGKRKSLIALNLAGAAVSELELEPLVLCRDPQGTAMLAHAKGNLPFDVKPSYPKEASGYDLVIADHMASDWEVPPAPTVIIPTKPVRTDYATFRDALTRLEKAGKRIIQVVTDGSMSRQGERAMILAMRKEGAFEIRSCGAFSRAAEEYQTIFDPAVNRGLRREGAPSGDERHSSGDSSITGCAAPGPSKRIATYG